MVGFTSLLMRPLHPIPSPLPSRGQHFFPFVFPLTVKPQPLNSLKPQPLLVFAVNNNNGSNNKVSERAVKQEQQKQQQQQQPTSSNGEEDANNFSKQRRPLSSFNWNTLLDPDPDNVLALGLTGLLTWASVQVLWQLLFISLAILVAALKYSFIAALLVFILITLL